MPVSSSGLPSGRERLVVPEFGLDVPLAVAVWLVAEGATVTAGDRVVQLVAGGITIDLEAPVTGRLVSCLVEEDESVAAGAAVAEFERGPRSGP